MTPKEKATRQIRQHQGVPSAFFTHLTPPIIALLCVYILGGLLAAQQTPPDFSSAKPVTETAASALGDSPSWARESTAEGPIPTRSLWSILREGGPLMVPITMCSLVLFAVVFERMIMLRRGRVLPKPFYQRFLHGLRLQDISQAEALDACLHNGSPLATVFAGAIRKWGRPSVEIEQGVLDAAERVAGELRRNLRILNGVATISPLLGLLGTVLGMIHAFNAVATADALGRPELLAKGISQALLTTAAGLTVAIPAILAYLYFVGRTERLLGEIDALAQQIIPLIAEDGVNAREEKPTKSRRKKTSGDKSCEMATSGQEQ
ncbi:MAG: MotA/TolQ/ExbB proton channel family protein [Thermoguttaceae bacterium]|nr:MotA/TolQ/ExbB proton channel family protein [Thermoguttaceae bacterium]MDW8077717.1 MotA/TolQ/ExbB proton channel family protein [Thermoguttaceae bacterium]